ncbi:deoxycytidyl transferase, partial [Cryomyces antarcticus]
SLKKNPEYKDKPAVVAHGGGSGSEIASCNYPAREFGVKNGMWMQRAKELCSELKVLPYDFPAYEEASRGFYNAILATGGIVQSVSIDEALVDVSLSCIAAGGSDGKRLSEGSAYREQAKADEIAQGLRDRIMEKTGCAVSVGIGGNILLAKVALRKAKPAGQYQIKPEEILDFIGKLGVQDLPG